MNMPKHLFAAGLIALTAWGTTACNNDKSEETPQANVNVKARAVAQNEQSSENARSIAGANIISMDVAFDGVQLKGSTESSENVLVPVESNTLFTLNLINSALPLSQNLGSVMLNQGQYNGITLQLKQDSELEEGDDMHEKTLLIEGNVNEQLMAIYLDSEENLTAAANGGSITVEGDQELFLNFDLNVLLEGIDLTLAADGDGDGVIEIEPTNKDGNRSLYLAIVSNLESAIYVSGE